MADTYRIYGAQSYSVTRPDHSTIVAGYTTVTVTFNQLKAFWEKLHTIASLTSSELTSDEIAIDLADQAALLLNLPIANPIKGVYVERSRPSGDLPIWREDTLGFWFHPTTTLNGASSPAFAVAEHAVAANPGWVSASVVGYRV